MQLMGGMIASLALSGCSNKTAPIRIGLMVWPGYDILTLASSLGWFDGLPITLVDTASATESLQLLEQGKIDAAGLSLDEVLRARDRGIDLTAILVCDISAGADQFLVRPNINSLAELKGLRIGFEDSAVGEIMFHQVLKAADLRVEDVIRVPLTIDKHLEAWKAGTVDAIATYEPAAGHIANLGGKVIFDSRAIPDLIVDLLAVKTSLLDPARETLLKLVEMHFKALSYLTTNSGDAAYRLAPRFKLPPEEALSVYRGLVLPDAANNHRLLGTVHPALSRSVDADSEVLQKIGILRQPPRKEHLLTPDFLPRLT